MSKDYIITERDIALFLYQDVLRSNRGTVKVADERKAAHSEMVTQLRNLFKESRKVKAVSSSAPLSKKIIRVAEFESALEVR